MSEAFALSSNFIYPEIEHKYQTDFDFGEIKNSFEFPIKIDHSIKISEGKMGINYKLCELFNLNKNVIYLSSFPNKCRN